MGGGFEGLKGMRTVWGGLGKGAPSRQVDIKMACCGMGKAPSRRRRGVGITAWSPPRRVRVGWLGAINPCNVLSVPVTWIRCDIAHPAAQLARFCAPAGASHWAALHHLMGHLNAN
jgi:hypothetical protein